MENDSQKFQSRLPVTVTVHPMISIGNVAVSPIAEICLIYDQP